MLCCAVLSQKLKRVFLTTCAHWQLLQARSYALIGLCPLSCEVAELSRICADPSASFSGRQPTASLAERRAALAG